MFLVKWPAVVVVEVVVMTVVEFPGSQLWHWTNQQYQHSNHHVEQEPILNSKRLMGQQVPILHEPVGFSSDCDLKCLVRALAVGLEEQQEPILHKSLGFASDCEQGQASEHWAVGECLVLVLVGVLEVPGEHRHLPWKYHAAEC